MEHNDGRPLVSDTGAKEILEQHAEVRAMMLDTVLSLLRSLVLSCALKQKLNRERIIALLALELCGKSVMDLSPTGRCESLDDFSDELKIDPRAKRFRPVCYEDYRKYVFEPLMKRIAECAADSSGLEKPLDPFTAAMVLALLSRYNGGTALQPLFAQTVDAVLSSLTTSYPPHYMFGGASLNNNEPHTFVSYYCLRSLRDTVQTLEIREAEHRLMAEILHEVQSWLEDPDSRMRNSYPDWEGFKLHHLERRLSNFAEAAGLQSVVDALMNWRPPASPSSADLSDLASVCVQALEKELTTDSWLRRFDALIRQEVLGTPATSGLDKRIADKASGLYKELIEITAGGVPPSTGDPELADTDAGAREIRMARNYIALAGLCWKRAFFAGMLQTLEDIRLAYQSLGHASSLRFGRPEYAANKDLAGKHSPAGKSFTIADVLAQTAAAWERSAQLTSNYISRFAHWAEAELYRQLSLDAARFKINFDPLQLAFALNVYDSESKDQNAELVHRGLDILFRYQSKEGLWTVGAPLDLVRPVRSAILIASIEVINAVMPLLKKYKEANHYHHSLYAVFVWLKTNRREVLASETGLDGQIRRAKVTARTNDAVAENPPLDLWLCASVLQFLYEHSLVLQEVINQKSLESYDISNSGKLQWNDLIDPQLEKQAGERLTSVIRKKYINPFLQKGSSNHTSMILYGPPGTAKTTLAKALAAELQWKLVTITPSDFVKQGIEQSERMARELFENLRQLREVVILFDEIDEMLRDRSDKEHDKHGIGMLRFLIPGMLPKLQDLKQHGEDAKIIFIIATNYFDRLDPAIRRRGRIDEYFLVPPPDFKSRCCQLEEMFQSKQPSLEPRVVRYYRELSDCIAERTAGWVRKDWESVVERAVNDARLRKAGIEEERWKSDKRYRGQMTEFCLNIHRVKREHCGFEWSDYEILRDPGSDHGFVRSLVPWDFYRGRAGARDELSVIMNICCSQESGSQTSAQDFINRIVTEPGQSPIVPRESRIQPREPDSD